MGNEENILSVYVSSVRINQCQWGFVLKRYRSFRCISTQRAAIKAADSFFCNSNAGNTVVALQGVRSELRLKTN